MLPKTPTRINEPNQPHDDIDDYISLSQRVFPSEHPPYTELEDLHKNIQTKHSHEALETYAKLADFHLSKNKYQDALKYLQLYYDIRSQGRGLTNIDKHLFQLVIVETLLCDFENANLHLDQCFTAYNPDLTEDNISKIELHKAKIRLLIQQGEYIAASKHLKDRKTIPDPKQNIAFTTTDKIEFALLKAKVFARQCAIQKMNDTIDYILKIIRKPEKGELDERTYPEIWNTLGQLYQFQGKYEQAKEHYKLSLQYGLDTGSENLLIVADTYIRLSDLYMIDGYYPQAFNVLEESNRICKVVLPEVHAQNSAYYANIGKYYTSQCNFKNAKEALDKALELRLKIFGKDHPLIVDTYQKLGEYYLVTTEFKLTIEVCEKALQTKVEKPSKLGFYDDAISYNGQGKALFLQQFYLEARKKFEKALEIMKELFQENHALVADYYGNLSITYGASKDNLTHLKYVKKALGIQKKLLGKNHPKTAPAYQSLSLIYGKMGDYDKALKKTFKAVHLREKFFGKYHPYVSETYLRLGMVYKAKGEYAEAIKHVRFSLEINLRFYEISNLKNGGLLLNLVVLFEKVKNFREAEKYRKICYMVKKDAKNTGFGRALDSLIDSSLYLFEISSTCI